MPRAYSCIYEAKVKGTVIIYETRFDFSRDNDEHNLLVYTGAPGLLVKIAYELTVAHNAGAYPGFCSMKRLGVFQYFYSPLDGMMVHRRATPQH